MISAADKILCVFSDPGGAKPLLSFLQSCNCNNITVISDRKYDFYQDYDTEVEAFSGGVEEKLNSCSPTVLLLGTSYTSQIEKEFLKTAKSKNIFTISYVDHYTSINQRFNVEEKTFIYPDQVWVIDEKAKNIAVSEGIDPSIIKISGNFYHEFLRTWQPKRNRQELLSAVNVTNFSTQVLLYVPDPLSNVNGIKSFGFDEVTATREFNIAVNDNSAIFDNWIIILKPHPNQNMKVWNSIKFNQNFYILNDGEVDVNHAIYYADVVLGFFSSILLEAQIMKKKIVRYIPETCENDPLKHNATGEIICNFADIRKFLN